MNTPSIPVSNTSMAIIYSLILSFMVHDARIETTEMKLVRRNRKRLMPSIPT